MTAEPTMPEIMGRMGRLTAYAVLMRPTAKYDTQSDEGRELMHRHLLFQLDMQDNYLYSEEELERFVEPIHTLALQTKRVHLMMNNCYEDKAQRNAKQVMELLGLA